MELSKVTETGRQGVYLTEEQFGEYYLRALDPKGSFRGDEVAVILSALTTVERDKRSNDRDYLQLTASVGGLHRQAKISQKREEQLLRALRYYSAVFADPTVECR